ncbi:MAG: DUF4199 domain-containing protein [Ferruginibacter sp.]|nr:DUF4199 domain-containing protein [Ferruginibacter sp.]
MKKIVIVNGIVAGLIVGTIMFITVGIYHKTGDFENGMLVGYASMLLAFSMIFVAVKNYRDKHNGGIISFGKAFKIGILITLIASSIYVAVWLFEYYVFYPDFGEKYTAQMLEKLKAGGASDTEIARQAKEMAGFNEMYKNPFFNALITYTEILPVGLLVTILCSFILKRKVKPAL